MLWIVYWDVSLLKKTFEEKKAIVAARRPKPVKRSFSALKRIKSFSQNKVEQDLGLKFIESQLLTEVMETKSFQELVVTEFASAEKRTEFTFKRLFASAIILKLCRFSCSALCSKQFCLNC